jgi:hypothetical protein
MGNPDSIPPQIRLQEAKRLFNRFIETGSQRDILDAIREAKDATDEMARIAYESPAPNLSAQ